MMLLTALGNNSGITVPVVSIFGYAGLPVLIPERKGRDMY